MIALSKKKLFELFFRIAGASTRPLAISIAVIYMPSVSKSYFSMVYLSPLIFKLGSLSDLVQYRRLMVSPAKFEESSYYYYFVVLSRILIVFILLFPFSVVTGNLKIWFALSIFCISDSFLMFNEIRFLLSGNTLRSAVYLVFSRILQVASLFFAYLIANEIVFFSAVYLCLVFMLAMVIYVNSKKVSVSLKRIIRYIQKKNNFLSYILQLRKASVEIASLAFFVATPTLISLSQADEYITKIYVISFSFCSFSLILFRVFFFNDRVKNFIDNGFDKIYLIQSLVFSLLVLFIFSSIGYFLRGILDVSFYQIIFLVSVFSIFMFVQFLNQVLSFFLSARNVGIEFVLVSSIMFCGVFLFYSHFRGEILYLEFSVILPALLSFIVNYVFYRKVKE